MGLILYFKVITRENKLDFVTLLLIKKTDAQVFQMSDILVDI